MLDVKRAQAALEEILKKSHAPSASVTVFDNGKVVSLNAGLRDIEENIPTDEDTMYAIGSSTKAFVAAALCILCDDGKLTLDDPVKKHIPEFEMYDSYVTENLTVRDILCHRCGLPRHEFSWYPRMESITPDEIVHRLRYLKPSAPFRYTMQYQNHMFLLAGYLVQRISGQKWEDFVRERIFKPLGMDPVNFNAARDMAAYPRAARGYSYDRETGETKRMAYKDVEVMGAAGSINSTTRQMVKWVALHLNEGKVGDTQIISQKMIRECHRHQMVIDDFGTGKVFEGYTTLPAYGLGWFIESYRGRKLVHHGGNIDGFSAMQCFLPGTGFGMSILTNQNASTANNAIMYTLIDLFFGDEPVSWVDKLEEFYADMHKTDKEQQEKMRSSAPKNAPPTFELEAAAGTYENPGYGELILTVRDGKLQVEWGSMEVVCEHVSYNHFELTAPVFGAAFPTSFETDAANHVVALHADLEPNIKERIVFKKIK